MKWHIWTYEREAWTHIASQPTRMAALITAFRVAKPFESCHCFVLASETPPQTAPLALSICCQSYKRGAGRITVNAEAA